MHRLILSAAFGIALAPMAALAQEGAGMIPCDQEVMKLVKDLDSHASVLTDDQKKNFRDQLSVAMTQCGDSLNAARPTLTRVQNEMQAAIQTAQTPADRGSSPNR